MSSTRLLKLTFLSMGFGLLAVLLAHSNLDELFSHIRNLGLIGLLAVVAVYAVGFLLDSVSWHLMLPSVPLTTRWQLRITCVRAVGEALNNVTPFGGFGGEPVKAMMLNRRFSVSYPEGIASLLLAKTTNLIALLVFLSVGFYLLIGDSRIPAGYRALALTGLGSLFIGVTLFFLIQRQRWSSAFGEWLSRTRVGRRLIPKLDHLRSFDTYLRTFYVDSPRRFFFALALAFTNWLAGVVELMVVFTFLGIPVTWSDAWMIEATTQLVRAGTFFIPASIGAQEGAFVVIVSLLTGQPSAGLACALVRRAREIIWIIIGLAIGWGFSFSPRGETHGIRTLNRPQK